MGHYYDCFYCGWEKGHSKQCPNNSDNWKKTIRRHDLTPLPFNKYELFRWADDGGFIPSDRK